MPTVVASWYCGDPALVVKLIKKMIREDQERSESRFDYRRPTYTDCMHVCCICMQPSLLLVVHSLNVVEHFLKWSISQTHFQCRQNKMRKIINVHEVTLYLFSFFKKPEYRCHCSDIKSVGSHRQQMIQNTSKFTKQH